MVMKNKKMFRIGGLLTSIGVGHMTIVFMVEILIVVFFEKSTPIDFPVFGHMVLTAGIGFMIMALGLDHFELKLTKRGVKDDPQ